jgi:hypothetical protein
LHEIPFRTAKRQLVEIQHGTSTTSVASTSVAVTRSVRLVNAHPPGAPNTSMQAGTIAANTDRDLRGEFLDSEGRPATVLDQSCSQLDVLGQMRGGSVKESRGSSAMRLVQQAHDSTAAHDRDG